MGLDALELVIAVEDEFKIALSNEETSRVQTVSDLVELVFSRLRQDKSQPCPSQHCFYVIRRNVIDAWGVERSRIGGKPLLLCAGCFARKTQVEGRRKEYEGPKTAMLFHCCAPRTALISC